MFNLMKKDKERDGSRKEKKDKKEKKERMSAAELRSLEEMSLRRGFFNLNRGSKRESRARLEISHPIPIKVASGSDLHLTDIEADGHRGSVVLDSGQLSTASSSDDLKVDDGNFKGSVLQRAAKFGSLAKQNSQMIVKRFSFSQRSRDESASETSTPSEHSAAPSPQVEARTLEMQLAKQGAPPGHPRPPSSSSSSSSSAPRSRVPELVGKRFAAELRLPAVVPPQPAAPRELELQRRNTGDFGFSLRRTTLLDRAPDGQVYRRVVHFAEPGAGTKDLALGLVPGDRLVEINGRNVESKSRDEIVEMIRQSGDTVKDEDKPLSVRKAGREEGAPENPSTEKEAAAPQSPEPPASPEPLLNGDSRAPPARAVNGLEGTGAGTPAQPEAEAEDGSGLSRKKMVRVVRKVVRKVLPGEEPGRPKEPARGTKSPEPASPAGKEKAAPRVASPAPAPSPKPEPKDELSMGLRSLMSRAKTKEHRSQPQPARRKGEEKPLEPAAAPGGKDPEKPGPRAPVEEEKRPGAKRKLEPKGLPAGDKAEPPNPAARKLGACDKAQGQADDAPAAMVGPASAASLPQAKTEEQIAAEEAWYETDKVWLVHKDGFSLASQLRAEDASLLPEGKVKVRLDHDGTVLEVDEDDVEKVGAAGLWQAGGGPRSS
ncbi:unconventional myosin-XVIIIa isoform B [Alligator mississippiensis]|uniref:Unconventional myosin-XVIIIa isoform B n=1 Tax=Alligator mississippiensis TaxID=8496 RepID=A0A151MUQ8_ALLMI|nr:unconventional myosin-XVIIIa isoform B [Alligator mississippiensis]